MGVTNRLARHVHHGPRIRHSSGIGSRQSAIPAPIHVVQVLEAAAGGTRTHLLRLLDGLDPARFRRTLICSTERDRAFRRDIERLRRKGVRVIEIPMIRRVSPARDALALARLAVVLRGLAPDVVHTHASKAGVLGRLAAWLCGVRAVVHTPHAYYFQGESGLRRWLYRSVERAAIPLSARVVALTEEQRRLMIGDLGADPRRIVVIPNGVDAARFSPRARKAEARAALGLPPVAPVFGTFSRFTRQKGCDTFLHAAARILRQLPDARGVFVAVGPERVRTRALARELQVHDRILWRDVFDDPRDLYDALDVFVLSSRYEGLPYTLLEAMSMSLPVIATRIPGCEGVVADGETGLLVPPDDPAALADAALRLLRNPAEAAAMGAAGRRRVAERFPLRVCQERTAALYRELAAEFRGAACAVE